MSTGAVSTVGYEYWQAACPVFVIYWVPLAQVLSNYQKSLCTCRLSLVPSQFVDGVGARLDAKGCPLAVPNDSAAARSTEQAAHGRARSRTDRGEQLSERDLHYAAHVSTCWGGRGEAARAAGKGGAFQELLQLDRPCGRHEALQAAKVMALYALRLSAALYDRHSDSPHITSMWHNGNVEEFIHCPTCWKRRRYSGATL